MTFRLKLNQPCRAFDITVDRWRARRHFNLLNEFSERGYDSPRGGSSRPLPPEKGDQMSRIVFFLNESVADEYIERMKKRITKEEKAAER